MGTFTVAALFIVGLLLIIKGGDIFVDAASFIAETTGIPKIIIGATVVSLATTLPELLVSLLATFDGAYDMAIGNAVGSVTANLGLIMGVSLLWLPGEVSRRSIFDKSLLMIASTLVLWYLCREGSLTTWPDSLLLYGLTLLFFALNIYSAFQNNAGRVERANTVVELKELLLHLGMFVLGAAMIIIGSNLLVDNGIVLARLIGVSEKLIGLTLVAIGTSLPEFVTTVSALVKRESSLSIGNILGANILDMTMILASCAFASAGSLPINLQTLRLDIPISLLLMVVATIPALVARRFFRWQGAVMLAIYLGYVTVLLQVA